MLCKLVTHETEDGFTIGPEVEDDPCRRCGAESVMNWCGGDGRSHWHGCVHTVRGGLEALCGLCAEIARNEWRAVANDHGREPAAWLAS